MVRSYFDLPVRSRRGWLPGLVFVGSWIWSTVVFGFWGFVIGPFLGLLALGGLVLLAVVLSVLAGLFLAATTLIVGFFLSAWIRGRLEPHREPIDQDGDRLVLEAEVIEESDAEP